MSRFICLLNFAGYPDGLLVEDELSVYGMRSDLSGF